MTTTVEPLNGNLRKRPRVALIGCGASGMCFLHALYTRHKRGDSVLLPYVVCYEQALEPGGCWRYVPEQDRNLSHNSACWYSDVWTNVSKEMYEFFDYNFEQHFSGRAVPSFLPRKDAFHYFKQRTLSIDQGLLDEGVHEIHELHYGTIVTNVTFDSDTQLFTVATAPLDPFADKRHVYQPTEEQEFDYCIWAAGTRGKPRIPRSLLTLFRSGQSLVDTEVCDPPFTGTILHSIHVPTPEFPPAVIGKRIVLIGDSDSALDLALHAVKLGVSKVDILSRSGYGECFYMGSWPEKVDPDTGDYEQIVDVHVAMPFRVIDDGRSIVGGPVIWNHIEEIYEVDEDQPLITIKDIDTIIFCTGYVHNSSFLSDELQIRAEELFSWCWSAPDNFKMRENALTAELGEVRPSADLGFSGNFVPGVYRTVMISNPKMMHIMDISSEYPLLKLEADAWLCLAFCTGDMKLPPLEVIDQHISSQMLEEMNVAFLRWSVDPNYFKALFDLGDDHWADDPSDPRTIHLNTEYLAYYVGLIARDLRDANYPVDFGTYGQLTELGEKLVQLGLARVAAMHTDDDADADWKTFRDTDPEKFFSIYTGKKSAALPKPWLELTSEDNVTGDEDSK